MDFDEVIRRTGSNSSRWQGRGDTLALTIGDADFRMPGPVAAALQRRLDHGVLGYDTMPQRVVELIVERLRDRHNWEIEDDWLVFLPGVVQGLNLACRACAGKDDGVISEVPVYYPFLDAPANAGTNLVELPARLDADGNRWLFDLETFESLASESQNTLLLLCNPHNPLGRVLELEELEKIAEVCQRHDVVICSDEIHCDVLFDGNEHRSIASLAPEVAARTITLMSPSKAFAISGLGGAFAVIPDQGLRARFETAAAGVIPNINVMALAAMETAYGECDDWLAAELNYLQENRDYLVDRLSAINSISLTRPEAAYFLWLDFRRAGFNDPWEALCDAGVELSEGAKFGGSSFLRLNFASARSQLQLAADRIAASLPGC